MGLPLWIQITTALSTPIIAIVGSVIAFQNHALAKKRRKDELFDRRYEFYQKVREYWLSTSDTSEEPLPDELFWISLSEEAAFLFGKSIAAHIVSLGGKKHTGVLDFPNSDFIEPFSEYLCLD